MIQWTGVMSLNWASRLSPCASALCGQGVDGSVRGSRARAIEKVPTAESKKAEGASVALLILNPPRLIGKDTWIQLT